MTHLRDEIGETVSLYIRSGNERIRIQAVESTQSIRNVAIVGKTYPLYVGASGKVLLAFSEPSLTDEVISTIEPAGTADQSALRNELLKVRVQGYATSIQERDPAAAALAVPVFDRNGVIAALSISGPASRFSCDKMETCLPLLLSSAKHIMQHITH
jgi:DNA-binding IclR family transcriptional regulator